MNRVFAGALAVCAAVSASAAVIQAPLAVEPIAVSGFSSSASAADPLAAQPLAAVPALLSPLAPPLAAMPALFAAPATAAAPADTLPEPRSAAPNEPAAPGVPGEASPAQSAAPSPEEQAVNEGAAFDGTEQAAPAAAPAVLGAGLKAADAADEEWLNSVVGALSRSKTGRRVLRGIAALAERRGHPMLVVVKPISNNGEFRYDADLLVMDAAHRRAAPEEVAPIFAHELQHVLQRGQGLPADALELEVESYTVESRVWTELGVEPKPGSFARQARRRLAADLDEFLTWLGGQYNGNRSLHGGTDAAYADWLREQAAGVDKRIARAEKKLAAARRIAERMRAAGKPEEFTRSFVQDDVEPLERLLRALALERTWCERDIALLSSPEGRRRFRAYSRGVIRRARALSRP